MYLWRDGNSFAFSYCRDLLLASTSLTDDDTTREWICQIILFRNDFVFCVLLLITLMTRSYVNVLSLLQEYSGLHQKIQAAQIPSLHLILTTCIHSL